MVAGWRMALGTLCMAVMLTAQAQQAEPTETASAPQEQELRQDPLITTGTLENGMRYVIRPTKEPAGRGSVRLRVNVGSMSENDENTGFSHLLEHMVFNGSSNFRRGELIPVMQKLGLGFGGDANAYTGLQETVYMLDLPNLQEKTVDTALTIMRDFADGATLEDEAIEKERGIVISELKARDSAEMRAHVQFLEQLTEGTRTAKYMPIGKEEVLRHGSPELVRKHYRDYYTPGNMTLILTGNFVPEEAEAWVKRHFEGMQARESAARPDVGQLTEPQQKAKLIPNDEQADVTLYVTVVKPYQEKADTAKQRAQDLPLKLACAMLERRLRRISHTADSPFTRANVEHQDLYETAELSTLGISARPEQWRSALQAGVQELRQAMQYGFTPDELKEATDALMSNLQQACATWETIPAAAMADRIVAAVGKKAVMTDAQENLRALQPAVAHILDNPDLCQQALRETFDLKNARLTMMGRMPQDATPEALCEEYFDKALQAPVQKKEEQALKPFAYETIGMPGVVLHREYWEDLGVTILTLSNGIRVNLKPVNFRKGTVSVQAAMDGGLLSLPSTPGLANMIHAVMNRGGLQEHSYDELERLLAARQVSLNFGMTPTRFIFSGNASSQDLELQCKLIAAAILYPGYREEGATLLRRNLDNEYRELETTPGGVYATKSRRAIFGDNVLFTVPKREDIEARTTHEVMESMRPLLEKNYMEITLVGDFDVEATLPILERTFGAMPQRQAEPRPLTTEKRRVDMHAWGQNITLPYPTQLDKTLVARVHAAGNGRDRRRNRRLDVLASILRNKLFDGLRAAMGESYSPQVQVQANDDFDNAALITTISAGVKRNRPIVKAAMESICNGIGQGSISDEEFQLAIRPYRAMLQKSLITPTWWEHNLLDLQSDPERRSLMREVTKDVESITSEEIRALGREIFGKDTRADFFFVTPEDDAQPHSSDEETSANVQQPPPPLPTPGPGEYAVVTTAATADIPEWKAVAQALLDKYPGAKLCVTSDLSEETCTKVLREARPLYVAFVMRPEEVTRVGINNLHRATRKIDDDPYGDCIWGIITGYCAEDALRIAQGQGVLELSRLLAIACPDNQRFEHSYCMSEQEGLPITERSGDAASTTTFDVSTPEGREALQDGIQMRFSYQLSTQNPQLLITATQSSPFNLEMPLCKGLVFSSDKKLHSVGCQHLIAFASARQPAMQGKTRALQSLVEAMHFPTITPDRNERVWLALGPGQAGNAAGSRQSLAVTAISAYGCHQFVGSTLPSWYGEAAAAVCHFFLNHTDDTTLAQAVFLSNQLLIAKTLAVDPQLMKVEPNGEEIGPELQRDILNSGVRLTADRARDAAGLVLERDALVFYGDPARPALVSCTRKHAPLSVTRADDGSVSLRAEQNYSGPAAILLRSCGKQVSSPTFSTKNAIVTSDFILLPEVSLKKGEMLK